MKFNYKVPWITGEWLQQFNRCHDAILFFTFEFVNVTMENGDEVLLPLLSVNWYDLLQICRLWADFKHFLDLKNVKPIRQRWQNSPILNTWNETSSHAPHCTQVCGFFSYPVKCCFHSVWICQTEWAPVEASLFWESARGEVGEVKAFRWRPNHLWGWSGACDKGRWFASMCHVVCLQFHFKLLLWVGRREMRTRMCACAAFRMRECRTSSACVSGSVSPPSEPAGWRKRGFESRRTNQLHECNPETALSRLCLQRLPWSPHSGIKRGTTAKLLFRWLIPFSGLTRRETVQGTDSKNSTDWAETRRRCFLC